MAVKYTEYFARPPIDSDEITKRLQMLLNNGHREALSEKKREKKINIFIYILWQKTKTKKTQDIIHMTHDIWLMICDIWHMLQGLQGLGSKSYVGHSKSQYDILNSIINPRFSLCPQYFILSHMLIFLGFCRRSESPLPLLITLNVKNYILTNFGIFINRWDKNIH